MLPSLEFRRVLFRSTSRIEGKVDLRGTPPANAIIAVEDPNAVSPLVPYDVRAPVAADGTFVVDGLPHRALRVSAAVVRAPASGRSTSVGVVVHVDKPIVTGVELSLATSKRTVYAIVRSTVGTPVANAQVFIVPGARPNMTALDLIK